MRRASVLPLALLALPAIVQGCRAPTEITVEVSADFPCAGGTSAAITVGTLVAIEPRPPGATRSACDSTTGRIGALVVVPSGSKDAEIAIRVVVAPDGASVESCVAPSYTGCIVARRALRFLPSAGITLPIVMRASCKDKPCEPSQTCVQGACADAHIPHPEECPGLVCGEPALAPARDGGASDAADAAPACSGAACISPLAVGSEHTCAFLAGALQCWGDNLKGQLGTGGMPMESPTPLDVLLGTAMRLTGVARIAAGHDHGCAFLAGGDARCWGRSTDFELGQSTEAPYAMAIPIFRNATEIALGDRHTCWRNGDALSCIGANDVAQMGAGAGPKATTPVSPAIVGPFAQIVAGFDYTCVLKSADKSIWCWGANTAQQSNPTSTIDPTPTPATFAVGGTPVELALSREYGCARLDDGTVSCWGANDFGQLGHLPTGGQPQTPSKVKLGANDLQGVTQLALGLGHACALSSTRRVMCWGNDSFGELGRGQSMIDSSLTNFTTVPAEVVGLSGVTFIAAGTNHTCAVAGDGHVYCWGQNTSGQLGTGDFTPRSTPYKAL